MKKLLSVLSLLLTLSLFSQNIWADEVDGNIKFSVEAILPDNQIDKEVGYFHLLMGQSQKQEIRVKVINLVNSPITVEGSVHNATTNSNGVIEYEESSQKPKGIAFESIVSTDVQSMDLQVGETKDYIFNIALSDTQFEGVILGGFNFNLKEDHEVSEGIKQTYSYSISAALVQKEGNLKSSKGLELNSVMPKLSDGLKVMNIQLENTEANIMSDLGVKASILDSSGQQVLFERISENMEMAPLTIMDYSLNIGRQDLKSGTYRYRVEATSFEQSWLWEDTFTIESDTAKEINEKTVNKVILPNWIRNSLFILGILTLLNATLIIIEARKKEATR